jgi:hypothetical protein
MAEDRKSFYAPNEFNLDREQEGIMTIISHCNLAETLKAFRDITYDQVSYFGDDAKGVIYNGKYSDEQIDQATKLQRTISGAADMLGQIILNGMTFDEGYAKMRIYSEETASEYASENERLKKEVANLNAEIKDLKDKYGV